MGMVVMLLPAVESFTRSSVASGPPVADAAAPPAGADGVAATSAARDGPGLAGGAGAQAPLDRRHDRRWPPAGAGQQWVASQRGQQPLRVAGLQRWEANRHVTERLGVDTP